MGALQSRFSYLFRSKEKKGNSIDFDTLEKLANNTWHMLGGFKVVGTVVAPGILSFFDEVEEGAELGYHYHENADEIIKVITGEICINDYIILKAGESRFLHAGDEHKVVGRTKSQLLVNIYKRKD